ncbi:MAG: hypothetical protein AB1585_05980 [Thermodesulfobacteriota bacterium]
MNNQWYEIVDADRPLTQGDIIANCPIVTWEAGNLALKGSLEAEVLSNAIISIIADVVVMTQACDLEQNKVPNVILCSHISLSEYKKDWEAEMKNRTQNPTDKAWKAQCDGICDGFIWNFSMINECKLGKQNIETRIVDFREVFNLPRQFLESLLQQRNVPRFRLLPPYREHLSQAFARFFMRVGLPVSIAKKW